MNTNVATIVEINHSRIKATWYNLAISVKPIWFNMDGVDYVLCQGVLGMYIVASELDTVENRDLSKWYVECFGCSFDLIFRIMRVLILYDEPAQCLREMNGTVLLSNHIQRDSL